MAKEPPENESSYGKGKRSKVEVREDQVIFSLSSDDAEKMRQCLQRSGEIKLTFKELRATRLPHTLDDGVLID